MPGRGQSAGSASGGSFAHGLLQPFRSCIHAVMLRTSILISFRQTGSGQVSVANQVADEPPPARPATMPCSVSRGGQGSPSIHARRIPLGTATISRGREASLAVVEASATAQDHGFGVGGTAAFVCQAAMWLTPRCARGAGCARAQGAGSLVAPPFLFPLLLCDFRRCLALCFSLPRGVRSLTSSGRQVLSPAQLRHVGDALSAIGPCVRNPRSPQGVVGLSVLLLLEHPRARGAMTGGSGTLPLRPWGATRGAGGCTVQCAVLGCGQAGLGAALVDKLWERDGRPSRHRPCRQEAAAESRSISDMFRGKSRHRFVRDRWRESMAWIGCANVAFLGRWSSWALVDDEEPHTGSATG